MNTTITTISRRLVLHHHHDHNHLMLLRKLSILFLLMNSFCLTTIQSFLIHSTPTTTQTINNVNLLLSPFTSSITSTKTKTETKTTTVFMSSFASDGSEYASKSSDYDVDDDEIMDKEIYDNGYNEDNQDPDVEELKPVPMSKNAGNRFVALYFDSEIDIHGRNALDLHYDRDELNEDHVMFCRKKNLYNETFNTDSMVDILRSLPILSSDLQRIVGQALVMETPDISNVYDLLKEDPVLQSLTGGDTSNIPLYRWRHIRDYTLRIDDGRFGYPCMIIALDDEPEIVGNTRQDVKDANLKYLISSERVIAAGPLFLPTEIKDDPSSIAVGDFILFNAKNREEAIDFAEDMPSAMEGLYKDMRVHFYNSLDVTGKFVSEDPLRDAPAHQMKEAMEYWGYPVDDDQTPWLNW